MENTSGRGPSSEVPSEIDRWNWGAFLLSWIWGIGNSTMIALLVFIPLVGFVMMFVLGARGSAWAWRNRHWDSIEQFRATQRTWARWGIAVWILLPLFVVGMFLAITHGMKSSGAYQVALANARANGQVVQIVGEPMSAGTPMGNIQVSGPDGRADLSFDLEGPHGKGTVYVEAEKHLGQWEAKREVFQDAASGRRIDIRQP